MITMMSMRLQNVCLIMALASKEVAQGLQVVMKGMVIKYGI